MPTGQPSWLPAANVFEAEALDRANLGELISGYGEGIGVIATSGGGYLEYDLHLPASDTYLLATRFAAEQARPVEAFIDDITLGSPLAAEPTGGWNPINQQWRFDQLLHLTAGKHTFKLLRKEGPFPRIDKFAFVPAKMLGVRLACRKENTANLEPHFTRQWAQQLAESYGNPASVLATWHRFESAVKTLLFSEKAASPGHRRFAGNFSLRITYQFGRVLPAVVRPRARGMP